MGNEAVRAAEHCNLARPQARHRHRLNGDPVARSEKWPHTAATRAQLDFMACVERFGGWGLRRQSTGLEKDAAIEVGIDFRAGESQHLEEIFALDRGWLIRLPIVRRRRGNVVRFSGILAH